MSPDASGPLSTRAPTPNRPMPPPGSAELRALFPILSETSRGKRLAYLDNAATTQKPTAVIDAIANYYRHSNANVHRAVHELAERATGLYEGARDTMGAFFNVARERVVFTSGCTGSINLVAYSFLRPRLEPGDEILVTGMEHHSNIVPWQLIAAERGAKVVAAPVLDTGELDFDAWKAMLSARTKMVAVVHVSNSLGTVNPVEDMIREARARGIPVLVDGAQAIAHRPVDFPVLDADFYTFSAHKAYGPTGFGGLIAAPGRLDAMGPWLGGGDMIETVSFEGSTWNEPPYRFEAGTPNIAGAVGTAAAFDFLKGFAWDALHAHEASLLAQATEGLAAIDGVRLVGQAPGKAGIVSFVAEWAHPQDIASVLDQAGVAVRVGHHCTMPVMARLGVPGTVRASLAMYNDTADVEQLLSAVATARRLMV